jgi:hypothetical protein
MASRGILSFFGRPARYAGAIALVLLGSIALGGAGSLHVARAQTGGDQAANLRFSLDQLLSEHADLAVIGMQKGFDGAPDFQAAAAQLSKNTDALSGAIQSVYGADAANQFKTLWTNHIGFFVNYAQAVKASDTAKKQKALSDLAGYKGQIAALLSGANPNLPDAAVQQLFQQHIDQLTGALDAYAAKDYAKAYTLFDQSHAHMFMAGNALSGAIAKQFSQKFPATAVQMPNTGTAGLADPARGSHDTLELALIGAAALLLAGACVFATRGRR